MKDPTVLGTNDVTVTDFSIYPNPAKNNINIQSQNIPLTQVEIFNVLGQRILSLDFTGSTSENIDISSLNSGMYLVKINDLTTQRLIVK